MSNEDESKTRKKLSVNPARLGVKVVALIVLLGIIWVGRPLFHPILYPLMYSPTIIYALGLPLIAALVLYLLPPMNGSDENRSMSKPSSIENKGIMVALVFIVGFALAITAGLYGGMVEDRTLSQETMSDAEPLTEFPEINADNPRIVPRDVADVQTRGSVSYRTHRLGHSDIARMDDGRLAWSYPIQPDQFNNRLNDNQRGVLLSDMTSFENREMQAFDEHEFVYGEGQLLHRSTEWQLLKQDFMVQYNDDPIEFVHDDDAYMAFPKTGHEWHLTPVPHTTPTWEGVALVHQDGTIEHLSPEEAQENEVLDGQRLYPLDVSKAQVESLTLREGITNTLPLIGSFENVVEPASLPAGAGNEQPFVIDLAGEQMSYVYAMEPPGSDSRGLDEVWFVDASTGEPQYFGTEGDTLLGPERAVGIVRSEDSQTNWDTGDGDGQFQVVEPVPVTVDDELWWQTKVVPSDNTDVSRNVFINAHTGEAIEMVDTDAVIEFLSGSDVEDIDEAVDVGDGEQADVEPAPDDVDAEFELVIRDGDGNVIDRIPIDPDNDISIEATTPSESEPETETETETGTESPSEPDME